MKSTFGERRELFCVAHRKRERKRVTPRIEANVYSDLFFVNQFSCAKGNQRSGLLQYANKPVECSSLLKRRQRDDTTDFSCHFHDTLHGVNVSYQFDKRSVDETTAVFRAEMECNS